MTDSGFVVTWTGLKFHRPDCEKITGRRVQPYVPGMTRPSYGTGEETEVTACGVCKPDPSQQQQAPPPRPPRPAPTVVYQLGAYQLSALQRDLFGEMVAVGFKRLAAIYHPDRGGATETMQALNDLRGIIDRAFRVR